MAIQTANNQQIYCTTNVVRNQSSITMASWIFRNATGTAQFVGFYDDYNNCTMIQHFSDNYVYPWLNSGSYSTELRVQSSKTITGWNHYAFVFDGSQPTNSLKLKFFINGIQETMNFGSYTVPSFTSNAVGNTVFRIGRAEGDGAFNPGIYAETSIWQSALTNDQVASLAKGFKPSCVFPKTLKFYLPLVRDIKELMNSTLLTNVNSTVTPHIKIYG